jgi:hypothetical protein
MRARAASARAPRARARRARQKNSTSPPQLFFFWKAAQASHRARAARARAKYIFYRFYTALRRSCLRSEVNSHGSWAWLRRTPCAHMPEDDAASDFGQDSKRDIIKFNTKKHNKFNFSYRRRAREISAFVARIHVLYLFMNLGFFSISETSTKATFVFVGTWYFTKIHRTWYQIEADDETSP